MKLDDMRVHSTNRDRFNTVSEFRVANESDAKEGELRVKSAGIVVKAGLCLAALLVALVIRVVSSAPEKVAEVGKMLTYEPQPTDMLGSLRYVDASGQKWKAPVKTNDVELLRDNQLVRFTAAEHNVRSCFDGKVLMIETDDRFGQYVRIQGADGTEAVLYGLESVEVRSGDPVAADQIIGSVPLGRSVYLAVLQNGAPQNPAEFVELSISGMHGTV